jgi:cytochrome bd-type quinol oxidase subunit 1
MYKPKPKKPTLKDLEKAAERLHNWNMTFLSISGALAYYYYRMGRYSFIVYPGTERYEMLMELQTVLAVISVFMALYIASRVYEITSIAKKVGKDPVEFWWRQLKARLKLF